MLPAPVVPHYDIELPISKQRVKYRPFLVKEERILLLAVEEESEDVLKSAIIQIIDNCTFNKLQVDKLPVADFEYLFVLVRSRSISEIINLNKKCTACDKDFEFEVNLNDIQVTNNIKNKNVVLSDNIIITMKFPTVGGVIGIPSDISVESIDLYAIASCIELITIDDIVHEAKDMSLSELVAWLEMLQSKQLNILKDWSTDLPKVTYAADVKCKHCGIDNPVALEGLNSFFV